ncbi:MAG: hypothetical protein QXY70_03665 [Nanopusillaceae archaeon]
MEEFSLIKNGKVMNVVIANQEFIDKWITLLGYDLAIKKISEEKGNIGQKYIDGKFYRISYFTDIFTTDNTLTSYTLTKTPQKDFENSPLLNSDFNVLLVLAENQLITLTNFSYNQETNSIVFQEPLEANKQLRITYPYEEELE